jgi:hypothetical protein
MPPIWSCGRLLDVGGALHIKLKRLLGEAKGTPLSERMACSPANPLTLRSGCRLSVCTVN